MTSEDILISLRKIIRALNLESKRIEKEFGISIPQLLCLNFLSRSSSFQANVKELSRALNLNPSTITGIIKRLEKKGYLARLPKKLDKRVSYITLTESGAQLLQKTPQLFHEKLDKKLQSLSPDKISQIKDGLQILTEILEVNELDAAPMLTVIEKISENSPNNPAVTKEES